MVGQQQAPSFLNPAQLHSIRLGISDRSPISRKQCRPESDDRRPESSPRSGGDGTAGYSGDGGAATSAELNDPVSVAVDANGNVFITEYNNNVIRLVSAATGTISTIAGNGTNGYSGDGGPATSAQLSYPHGVALDSAGNLYVGDCGNHRVRMVGNVTLTTVSVSVSPTSATLNASQQRQFIATVTNTEQYGSNLVNRPFRRGNS